MKIFRSLNQLSELPHPVILTIGNFDGVHLGHQAILKAVTAKAAIESLPSALITFENHPSTVLRPNHPIPLLTSIDHKLRLFEELNIDIVIVLDFTLPFSHQSAESFLQTVYNALPFRELILGYDAKLGNDRQGDTPAIHELARKLHFHLSFLPAESLNKEVISSSRIRKAVQAADLKEASFCLGRPYSVIGLATKNFLQMNAICTPPFGTYSILLKTASGDFPGVAHIRLDQNHETILEIPNHTEIFGQVVEVVFLEFLKPEIL